MKLDKKTLASIVIILSLYLGIIGVYVNNISVARLPLGNVNGTIINPSKFYVNSNLISSSGTWLNSTNISTSSLYISGEKYYNETEINYLIWKSGSTYYTKNGHSGAVTSGSNASIVIQAAINSGNHIIFKPGIYILTGQIRLKSNLIIEGSGNATIITIPNSYTKYSFFANNTNNIVIKNLEINGNGNNQDSSGSYGGITILNSGNVIIDKLTIINMNGSGIILNNNPANYNMDYKTKIIEDCIFYNIGIKLFGAGVYGTGRNVIIRDNYFKNLSDNAVAVDYACNWIITGNTAISSVGLFISDNQTYNIIISNNDVLLCSYGVICAGIHDFIINSNQILNCTNFAIYIEVGSGAPINSYQGLISNNIIKYSANQAIYLNNVQDIKISDNIINLNFQNGIQIIDCLRCMITGNKIYDNGLDTGLYHTGIYMHYTNSSTIQNNNIYCTTTGALRNQRSGIWIDPLCISNLITNNYLNNNRVIQIYNYSTNNTIKYNYGYITENSGTATILLNTSHIQVTHGLSYTPSVNDITLSLTSGIGNCTCIYVDPGSITSTNFQVYCGTSGAKWTSSVITFVWDIK